MLTEERVESSAGLAPLVTGIIKDAQALFRQQLSLFQVELKNDLDRRKDAAIPFIIGGVVSLVAALVLSIMAAHLIVYLWPQLPLFAGFAIVGGVLGAIAIGLLILGKKRADSLRAIGEKAIQGLKENIQWTTKT